ncbi:Putative monooxygenase [Corynebacterium glyciniphilum AJ 3170]|uniref:Putative monooxygenase n=2 Tax=Corynebacterium TaxID=1716 RepID=X5E6W1_9CORY|nr:Putative monooxygenase [Corynebacterium glyciniphilum AJ 3170]
MVKGSPRRVTNSVAPQPWFLRSRGMTDTQQSTPSVPPSPRPSIAVIGAGLTGVNAALAFQSQGWQVDLYSNRSRSALRDDLPATGTAILFGNSRVPDRTITDDHYAGTPTAQFAASSVGIAGTPPEASFTARFTYEAQSVDPRLRADDRLGEFLDKAATTSRFIVDEVTPETLDTIAADHDLTFVATGKAGLADLFETDLERTPYDSAQRYLLTVTAHGLPVDHVFRGRGSTVPGGLLSLHEDGEIFVGPHLHKDGADSSDDSDDAWVILAWARPGTATEEAFRSATDAREALDVLQSLHHREFPDVAGDIDWLHPIDTDPHSWLKGAVTPRVHRPTARTAGGHLIATLGDTSVAVDPIAGQGAQLATYQVAGLRDGLRAALDDGRDWDEELLTELFDHHWQEHAEAGVEVTSLFLGDPLFAEVAQEFFASAAADPAAASALFSLFSDPSPALVLRTAADVRSFAASFRAAAA